MTGDFDDVIDAAENPYVAVFVALRGVAGEINAGDFLPVLALVTFVVTVDSAEHRRPRLLDREVAGFAGLDRLILHIHNAREDTGEWQSGGAGLCRCCAGQRRNHDRTRFGLPPSVHDGTAIFSDGFEIPFPSGGVDGLSNRAEKAKARQVVRLDSFPVPA